MLDRSKEAVRELLDAHRHVVEALSAELLDRNELVGAEITGVIEKALAAAAIAEPASD